MVRSSSRLRWFATVWALVGWFALITQFYLSVQLGVANGNGVVGGVVAYFSYFTILTNILAALALTAAALPTKTSSAWRAFFRRPGVITTITASIILVGGVYFLILRHIWNPQGLQWLADVLLHYVMPPLFVAYWWWAVPKALLHPPSIFRWAAYPLGYAIYALILGVVRGRYPYPFIDVLAVGYPRVLVNTVGLMLIFAFLCLVLIGLGRFDQRRPFSRLG